MTLRCFSNETQVSPSFREDVVAPTVGSMERRRLLTQLGGIGAVATAPWMLACAPVASLKVGIHPWIGYETLRLARSFHWLSESVLLHEAKDLNESSRLLELGKVDAACLTLDEVLRIRSTGVPVVVALVFDVSEGSDVIIAKPTIRRLQDLAHQRIGVEKGALGALMTGEMLRSAGLNASDVQIIEVPTDRQVQAWRQGTIDAAISYEPTSTLLLREGGVRLFDSRQIPDTIVDVLAVRQDRITGHQGDLYAVVRGHFKGLSHMIRHREDAAYRIAATQRITHGEVRQALAGIRLPSLQANHEYLATGEGRILGAAKTLMKLMVREGLLPQEETLAGLANSAWLPEVEVV